MLHEFSVTMPLSKIDHAIESLNSYGYYNSYYDQPIEQYAEENGYGYIELQDDNIDLKVFLEDDVDISKTLAEIAAILQVNKEDINYRLIENMDFQQPFPVIDLKNGWFIVPTTTDELIDAEGKIIHFEPPRAFGSGLHQTTQDCLRLILREDLQEKKILDIGTGAGLLSIAAALVGAEHITAIDIEDIVAEVTYNAGLNKVEKYVTPLVGDVLNPAFQIDGEFDWIFVNIAANEVKQLQGFIDTHLAPNGRVILSGMVDWNYKEALALYEANGYSINEILHSDEWVTALVTKG